MTHGGCVQGDWGRPPVNPNTGLPYLVNEDQERMDRLPYRVGTEFCAVCSKPVVTITFRGTGVCCEICRKKQAGEVYEEPALSP